MDMTFTYLCSRIGGSWITKETRWNRTLQCGTRLGTVMFNRLTECAIQVCDKENGNTGLELVGVKGICSWMHVNIHSTEKNRRGGEEFKTTGEFTSIKQQGHTCAVGKVGTSITSFIYTNDELCLPTGTLTHQPRIQRQPAKQTGCKLLNYTVKQLTWSSRSFVVHFRFLWSWLTCIT